MGASARATPVTAQVPLTATPKVARLAANSFHRSLALITIAFGLLSTGCSNFDSRQRYWDQQLAGKLKAAPLYRLKSFAAANGHELNCNGDGISREGAPDLSECDLVDSRSKGALFNYRGKLFVMIKMVDGKVASHSFSTSTVLY